MSAADGTLKPKRSYVDVYDRDDPRGYFRAMERLGYRQPEVMAGFFDEKAPLIARHLGKGRLQILDFGCGYGVMGAVMRHRLLMQDLYAHYAENLEEDFVDADRAFFADHRRAERGTIIGGLDIAAKAVGYAEACGLIDQGFTEDLTREDPGSALAVFFAETDVVVETGAVYDHVPACYDRLLAAGARPWMLFGPRGDADTRPLFDLLQDYGYVIEEVSRRRRRYRRFADAQEAADSQENMRRLGNAPAVESRKGWFVNPLLLARQQAEIADLPVEALAY